MIVNKILNLERLNSLIAANNNIKNVVIKIGDKEINYLQNGNITIFNHRELIMFSMIRKKAAIIINNKYIIDDKNTYLFETNIYDNLSIEAIE